VRGRPCCFVRGRAECSSEAGDLARSRDGQEDRYGTVRLAVMKMMNRHCGTIPVARVMKGSMTISGQKIEYPKTDKAEPASVLVEIQPRRENGFSIGRNIVEVLSASKSG
jgi:hypothetical protein